MEDLVSITFDEQIPEDKIRKNDSENMSFLQNDVRRNSRYVKILMDSGPSVSIIHDSSVRANKFDEKLPRISGPLWLDLFRRHAKQELKLNFQN